MNFSRIAVDALTLLWLLAAVAALVFDDCAGRPPAVAPAWLREYHAGP